MINCESWFPKKAGTSPVKCLLHQSNTNHKSMLMCR
jgi:hypothetical protein